MTENPYQTPDESNEPVAPVKKGSRTGLIVKLLVGVVVVLFLIALWLPAQRGVRPAALRMQCSNNLKQVMLALHNYEETYHALPPAYTVDEQGNPLHSWRTLILPYIEQKALYDKIDLAKPWNDPVNQQARDSHVPAYACPSADMPRGNTNYLAIVSADSCLQPGKARPLSEITDEHRLTLVVVETDAEHSVPWMEPTDMNEDMLLEQFAARRGPHPQVIYATFVDGSVGPMDDDTSAVDLKALISIAGNDPTSRHVD